MQCRRQGDKKCAPAPDLALIRVTQKHNNKQYFLLYGQQILLISKKKKSTFAEMFGFTKKFSRAPQKTAPVSAKPLKNHTVSGKLNFSFNFNSPLIVGYYFLFDIKWAVFIMQIFLSRLIYNIFKFY